MPNSKYSSLGSPPPPTTYPDPLAPVMFVHTISEAGRLLPSSSRWNSIELDFNLFPQSSTALDSLPPRFSKSVDFDLVIRDKKYFKRFVCVAASLVLAVVVLVLVLKLLPHKHHQHGSSKNLRLALGQALVFFDAQKSGYFPKNNLVNFRGDSGTHDGNTSSVKTDLIGGFYDSGNNIKFSFPTAYTITLLSWTVLEYHQKYAEIGELEHVKDIVKWGGDYLLKVFVPPNTNTSDQGHFVFSGKVGSTVNDTKVETDLTCWQRPEDMTYPRPVSICDATATDLAAEVVAALSAASLVFKQDKDYSAKLVKSAEELFDLAMKVDTKQQTTYTSIPDCGGQARLFYNSSGCKDELVWGGTWLFFATGNESYLRYATGSFAVAEEEEIVSEKGVFDWNNKLTASAVLLTRLRFFRDLGYPYEAALGSSSNRTDLLMCSYVSGPGFNKTDGWINDVEAGLWRSTPVDYVLGDNPMKMSYVVGFGDKYPNQVHHRAASIPWDGKWHSCAEGERWLHSKEANPNQLLGAMVAGPDQNDVFLDQRDQPQFTEPSLSGNAGLVAALIALHEPRRRSSDSNGASLGIDKMGMFENIHLIPSTP
ncbi:glycosyl hydrolase 9A3 [Actinidia rufa]|uniref:Endoglucanase n=1 Tax=Actinidia rufa TaxID=165716 RepID=A0A7J0FCU5_9ERIC|nr:glycosyl hydrolase 9A3 [Actinidia rufa]